MKDYIYKYALRLSLKTKYKSILKCLLVKRFYLFIENSRKERFLFLPWEIKVQEDNIFLRVN